MYMIAYGNRYIVNVQESNIIPDQDDRETIVMNFLDSIQRYYIENILEYNEELPEDWFDGMFFEGAPIDNIPEHFLGITSYEYYISEIKGEDLCSIY